MIQRQAALMQVEGRTVSGIGPGLSCLVMLEVGDTEDDSKFM